MAASVINTNIMSMNAQRNLNKNSLSLGTSLERLSSGLRVNSARDDAAGLAVAMTLESSVRGFSVKIRNEADKISTAQKGDGSLSVATDILQRLNELAVQAQGTNGAANATKLATEFDTLNGQLVGLGVAASITTAFTSANAGAIVTSVATALGNVATSRASYGANIASAEFQIQNYENARMNDASARSRIMDADFAMETANLARGQILMQAGIAMVAQANQIPKNVLSLLR